MSGAKRAPLPTWAMDARDLLSSNLRIPHTTDLVQVLVQVQVQLQVQAGENIPFLWPGLPQQHQQVCLPQRQAANCGMIGTAAQVTGGTQRDATATQNMDYPSAAGPG